MMQGHSRSGEGRQITKKVVKFRAVLNKLVAHSAELCSAAQCNTIVGVVLL